MKCSLKILFFGGFFLFLSCLMSSCVKPPVFKVEYLTARATVVGKEICKADSAQDYWIVDVLIEGDDPLIGDEVAIDGVTYSNAFKAQVLSDEVGWSIGEQVSLEYDAPVMTQKVETFDCEVSDPKTYFLRLIFVMDSSLTNF